LCTTDASASAQARGCSLEQIDALGAAREGPQRERADPAVGVDEAFAGERPARGDRSAVEEAVGAPVDLVEAPERDAERQAVGAVELMVAPAERELASPEQEVARFVVDVAHDADRSDRGAGLAADAGAVCEPLQRREDLLGEVRSLGPHPAGGREAEQEFAGSGRDAGGHRPQADRIRALVRGSPLVGHHAGAFAGARDRVCERCQQRVLDLAGAQRNEIVAPPRVEPEGQAPVRVPAGGVGDLRAVVARWRMRDRVGRDDVEAARQVRGEEFPDRVALGGDLLSDRDVETRAAAAATEVAAGEGPLPGRRCGAPGATGAGRAATAHGSRP
jgi:hypothetical protein